MFALDYCKVDYETVFCDFSYVKTPEFLKKNPHGKVPCLETEEGSFYESTAIVLYLARKYSADSLYSTKLTE